MVIPFDNEILRRWFAASFDDAPCSEYTVSTVGSIPFPEAAFDKLLQAGGLEVFSISPETEILIIGQENWNEETLDKLLNEREGDFLKVYSQEMFLAYWLSGQDPFHDKDIAEAFAESHPALQYLSSLWVDWVSTNVSLNRGGDFSTESPEIGILKHLSYTVGKKGLPSSKRKEILMKVFNSNLDEILSPNYIRDCKFHYPTYLQEWGNPKSVKRLIKMRDSLSTYCKNQKKQGNIEAALDYEEDLNWLRNENRETKRFKYVWLNYNIER